MEVIQQKLEWRVEQIDGIVFHYGREADQPRRNRYLVGPWDTGFHAAYHGIDDSLGDEGEIGGRYDTLAAAKAACQDHCDKIRNGSSFNVLREWRIRLVRGLFCTCGYELQATDVGRDDSGTRLTCRHCRRDILIMD